MSSFAEQRQVLMTRFQMLQGQLTQAQNTAEQTKIELAKILGKLELLAEQEKAQIEADGALNIVVPADFEVRR